jgi:magnesium chelatase subunit I
MPPYPFSAIVGQEEMIRALLVSAVDPSLGGVLVLGHRGTGKSTAVRGLPGVLPAIESVRGCPYNCSPERTAGLCAGCTGAEQEVESRPVPVVDLPLGTTEDRLVGTLDLERALATGERVFEAGLLAKANRGFLYVDEVNLLDDFLVDLLLDVAASGENIVEREGVSIRHPAAFVLVGSGNPEEGDLRPQLLDRFGLSVQVTTPTDLEDRLTVVERRDEFDREPGPFAKRWRSADGKVRRRIERARETRDAVRLDRDLIELATRLCMELGIDGLRGELTLTRASRALAALEGRSSVTRDDLVALAPSVLRHRLRRDPLDESGSDARIGRALAAVTDGASPS